MDSVKILLFSDDEKLYNSTERIIGKKHQLNFKYPVCFRYGRI